MPIQKSFTDNRNCDGNLWIFSRLNAPMSGRETKVSVTWQGYKNQASFNAGAGNMDSFNIEIPIASFSPQLRNLLKTEIETLSLAAAPKLQGGTIV